MIQEDVAQDFIIVGKIVAVYGVRGGLKVMSYTQPKANLLAYTPWYLRRGNADWVETEVLDGREHGAGLVVSLAGCTDRDAAALWAPAQIAVRREQLPVPDPGEYYWADLVGLRVRTIAGVELGTVSSLFETGANAVVVVQGVRERLIPFIPQQVVREISLARGEMVVDWDPDF